jgi:hypothetical protein
VDAGQAERRHADAAGEREPGASLDRAAQPVAGQQTPAQHRAADVGERDRAEDRAVRDARGPEHVDEHERRAGEQEEQATVGAGREQGPGAERRVRDDVRPVVQSRRARVATRVAARNGFLEAPRDEGEGGGPNSARASSVRCQFSALDQQTAEQRAQRGDEAEA